MCRHMDARLLRDTWAAWQTRVAASAAAQGRAEAWGERRRQRLLRGALHAWAAAAANRRWQKAAQRRSTAWHARRLLRRATLAWQGCAAARATLRRMGERLGAARRAALLRGCVGALRCQAVAAAGRRCALETLSCRWHRSTLRLAMERWAAMAAARTFARQSRLAALPPDTRRALALGLGSWWCAVCVTITTLPQATEGRTVRGTAQGTAGPSTPRTPAAAGFFAPRAGASDAYSDANALTPVETVGMEVADAGSGDGGDGVSGGDEDSKSSAWLWLLQLSWAAWREQAALGVANLAAAERLRAAGEAKGLAAALAAWQAEARTLALRRAIVSRALQRRYVRRVDAVFSAWAAACAAAKSRWATADSLFHAKQREFAMAVLHSWRLASAGRRGRRLAGQRLAASRRWWALQRCVGAWRCQVLEREEQRERLRACIKSKKVRAAQAGNV